MNKSWEPLSSQDDHNVQKTIGYWSWFNEATDEWVAFSSEYNSILEIGFQARQDNVTFAEYEVDLFNMEQRNRWTQNVRPVKRTRGSDSGEMPLSPNSLQTLKSFSNDFGGKHYSDEQWAKYVLSSGQFVWRESGAAQTPGLGSRFRGSVFGGKKPFIRVRACKHLCVRPLRYVSFC